MPNRISETPKNIDGVMMEVVSDSDYVKENYAMREYNPFSLNRLKNANKTKKSHFVAGYFLPN